MALYIENSVNKGIQVGLGDLAHVLLRIQYKSHHIRFFEEPLGFTGALNVEHIVVCSVCDKNTQVMSLLDIDHR